ncbi:Peroxisome biogenesis factor 10 [Aphelenchoides besseyi]|nr:Peroxisome biogenesis factor 10 [Aphelenchoides besseyi]
MNLNTRQMIVGIVPTLSTADLAMESYDDHFRLSLTEANLYDFNFVCYPIAGLRRAIKFTELNSLEQQSMFNDSTSVGVDLSDIHVGSPETVNRVNGRISPWIDCDHPNAQFARYSTQQLDSALPNADYLGVRSVLIEVRRRQNPNLIRVLRKWLWLKNSQLRFWIIFPSSIRLIEGAEAEDDIWTIWSDFRNALSNYSQRKLIVGVRFGSEVDHEFQDNHRAHDLGVPFEKQIQRPLQPAENFLATTVYSTFEQHAGKYALYESAIFEASIDLYEDKICNTSKPLVIFIVGAGRGGIIHAALRAEERANKIRNVKTKSWTIIAVERNPFAVLTLEHMNQRQTASKPTDQLYVVPLRRVCQFESGPQRCFTYVHPTKEDALERDVEVQFDFPINADITAFAGYFDATLYKDIRFSTLPGRSNSASSKQMQTYRAEQSEILRASRKDDEFLHMFQLQLSDTVKNLCGDAMWIRMYKYLQSTTNLFYHFATTMSGVQTLGEEYLGLIQVSSRSRVQLPVWWRSFLWSGIEAFGPQFVDHQLKTLKQKDENYYQSKRVTDRTPIGRIVLSAILRQLSFSTLQNIHWAIFFLSTGTFYSVWKRALNIKYVTIRPQTNTKIGVLFKIIGITVLLQYLLKIAFAIRYDISRSLFRHSESVQSKLPPSSDTENGFYCDICLNSEDPVSSPCGHIYCYGCILFHSQHSGLDSSLGQCPQCRFQFELRSLIPILNL